MKVDNAIIMAAGTSSRFAPLSYEKPKALIPVKGEILIERQIRQLFSAGVPEVYVVTGYKGEMFEYLKEKFGVHLIHNPDFLTRNNNASIRAVKNVLKNSYICSADNYFTKNPFESDVESCYYSAVYADGPTKEWCLEYDNEGTITNVTIGGQNAWYMLGHTFWSEAFSKEFLKILDRLYDLPRTADMLWESIYMEHLDTLKMKIRKYSNEVIFEFDTLDELREFDPTYQNDTRSKILSAVAQELGCEQKDIIEVTAYKDSTNEAVGFRFLNGRNLYEYSYVDKTIRRI